MIVFPVSHRRRQRVFRRNGRLPPICQRSRAAIEERFRIHYRSLVQRRFHDEGDDPYRVSGMRPVQRMGARMVKNHGQPTGVLRRRQLARHRQFGHDQRLAPRSGLQLLRNRQALSRRNAARGRRGDFGERRQHDYADYRLKALQYDGFRFQRIRVERPHYEKRGPVFRRVDFQRPEFAAHGGREYIDAPEIRRRERRRFVQQQRRRDAWRRTIVICPERVLRFEHRVRWQRRFP